MDKNREINYVISVNENKDGLKNLFVSTCYKDGQLGKGYYLHLLPCQVVDTCGYNALRMNLSAQLCGGDIRQCGMRILLKRAPRFNEKLLQMFADNVKINVVPTLRTLWNNGDKQGIIAATMWVA